MNENINKNLTLVTGGSSGIGAEIVRLLTQMSQRVCFTFCHNQTAAEALVRETGASAYKIELGSGEDEISKLFDYIELNLGRLTGLVNNAGVAGPRVSIDEVSIDDFRSVMDINLYAAVSCMKYANRAMSTSFGGDGGSIVNITSQAGINGGNKLHPYAASKSALNILTKSVANDLRGSGVRVNAVSPGIIATDMNSKRPLDLRAKIEETIPIGRFGFPSEVADVVCWLLSDASSYVNGAIIEVTGGRP